MHRTETIEQGLDHLAMGKYARCWELLAQVQHATAALSCYRWLLLLPPLVDAASGFWCCCRCMKLLPPLGDAACGCWCCCRWFLLSLSLVDADAGYCRWQPLLNAPGCGLQMLSFVHKSLRLSCAQPCRPSATPSDARPSWRLSWSRHWSRRARRASSWIHLPPLTWSSKVDTVTDI